MRALIIPMIKELFVPDVEKDRSDCRQLSESVKMKASEILLKMIRLIVCRIAEASAEKMEAKEEMRYLRDKESEEQWMAKPTYVPGSALDPSVKK